ncbi:hypothetical protein [Baekduia sp. Peel2402]|uniref:hypothetical protein n=1 Tax=Baekduia sp. Peel2402 TaxID=3458296 RepID=UPI00403EE79F
MLAIIAAGFQGFAILTSSNPQWPVRQCLIWTAVVFAVGVVVAVLAAVIVVIGFLIGLFNDPVGTLGDLMRSFGLADEPPTRPDGGLR